MRKYLNMFRILYLILLLFVLVNFILSFYGYAFLYDYYGRKGENTEWKKEYRIMEKKF